MHPKDVRKWGPIMWLRQLQFARPSGGGAVGVTFAWARPVPDDEPPNTADFVIKPIQGTAAPTKFAEKILSKVANARSPNSEGIARMTAEGEALVHKLREFSQKPGPHQARWKEVLGHYEKAETFLIQETQTGVKEFGDEYREQQGLRTMLKNEVLMKNLGLLCAADALLGNGDRFDNVNTGNMLFTADGTLASIDSAAILLSFQSMVNDVHKLSWGPMDPDAPLTPSSWATLITKKAANQIPSATQAKVYADDGKQPVLPPTFVLGSLTDVDALFERFKVHVLRGVKDQGPLRQKKGLPPIVPPRPEEWQKGRVAFARGVEEGLRKIDQLLSGWSWLKVKRSWSSAASRYGADPNMDWTNLKVRRMFLRALAKGKSSDEIYRTIDAYVKKKGKRL